MASPAGVVPAGATFLDVPLFWWLVGGVIPAGDTLLDVPLFWWLVGEGAPSRGYLYRRAPLLVAGAPLPGTNLLDVPLFWCLAGGGAPPGTTFLDAPLLWGLGRPNQRILLQTSSWDPLAGATFPGEPHPQQRCPTGGCIFHRC